ncbi:MAG TPA: alpha/beta hydrolase [Steroidobacteraceae bacterium]|nr:alpha/beta hydrolase [Steroidobacteraceae bacterium]
MNYRPRRAPRHVTLELRGLNHHLVRWGPREARPAVFLHGWADTGATFQFLVDAFEGEHAIVALDWRGFGDSAWLGTPYWFPDYLADLDALLDALVPDAPATLLGHSMGGNIAGLYAGIRPERVRAVVNLEGIGLPRTEPDGAPARYRRWLDQLKTLPAFGRYRSRADFAAMLMKKNPRLSAARAAFVAESWTRELADGSFTVSADPAHRLIYPVPYRRDESEACWRRCIVPVLMVLGGLSDFRDKLGSEGSDEYLHSIYPNLTLAVLARAGHMMHHEEPEALAALVEPWLSQTS